MSAHDDVAAARGELLLHEDVVAAQDAGVDHRVAVDPQAEDLAPALDEAAVDAHRVDDVLFGEERAGRRRRARGPGPRRASSSLAGCAPARRRRRSALRSPGRVGPERARLHVLAREVALALERAQVIVHPVGRADAHARADLAERRRVAAVRDRLANEVEDHLLTLRQPLHRAWQPTEHAFHRQERGTDFAVGSRRQSAACYAPARRDCCATGPTCARKCMSMSP